MATFSSEQLNFFKFSTVVIDEFPVALRQAFVYMWDTQVAPTPGSQRWDDSSSVRKMFLNNERGKTKYVPTSKSYMEWDCTALFEATLFAKSFAMPDGRGGFATLDKLYVKPRKLPSGAFHPSVLSPGNQAETFALALDQLRLLRNTLCHQISTQKIVKVTFDHYIKLAKDAFAALGQSSTKIDDIGKLGEKDFPTARVHQLEAELRRENFKQIEDNLNQIESQVKDVGSDVESVKTVAIDVKTKVEDVGSDVKDMKTKVDEVESVAKDLKTNLGVIKETIEAGIKKGVLFLDSCVPGNIPHFVGRHDECRAMINHLTDEDTRLVNVCGPPGFGKTSVAIQVAHQLHEDMKIPVYFASLRGMESKDELVSKLLSMLTDAKQGPHVSSSHWLIQCLQQQKNPLILILDNADDLLEADDAKRKQQVLRFIEEILAQCKHIKLVLTSRESLNFLSLTLPIHIERITVLDKASSESLVQRLLPDVSEDDRSFIVTECGQVPLAIRLMCSMVKEDVSIGELQEELKSSPLVEVLDDESFSDDARLKTIINTSFRRLSPHERKAFVSLAVFPGRFGIAEAKAVLDLKTELQTKKIIRSLERKSLIHCEDNFSYFSMHSLLRSYVDGERGIDKSVEAEFLTAQLHFYEYYISRFELANEKFLTGPSNEASLIFVDERQSIFLSLTNGVRAGDKLYRKAVEVLCKAELFLFAVLLDEQISFEQLYDIAVQEAKRRQNVFDERQLLASKSFRHWGWFSLGLQTWDDSLFTGCTNKADWPAKLLCYYGVHQMLSFENAEGLSSILNSFNHLGSCLDEINLMGLVCMAFDELEEDFFEMHIEIYNCFLDRCSWLQPETEDLSLERNELLKVMKEDFLFFSTISKLMCDEVNLGDVAFPNGTPALSRKLQLHGEDLPVHLIMTNHALKELGENQEFWETFLDDEYVNFGANLGDPFLKFTDEILENGLNTLQSYNAAKQLMEMLSHDVSLEPFGDPPDNFFKDLFDAIGNVLKANENVSERNFVDLARSYDRLAMLKSLFGGDNHEAIDLYQQGMRVREKHIGDHVDTVSCLANIGCLYFKMQNEIEADKALQSALELRKRLDIYDDVDTISIYSILGENHCNLGNYNKALEARLQALKLRKKHLGAHPLTAETFFDAGCIYFLMESHQEALEFFQQALAIRLELLGEHKDTAETFNLLGCIHFKMDENMSAIQYLEAAVDMRLNVLGDHEDTASSYHDLGEVQFAMRNLSGALESFTKASQLREELLGEDLDTAKSLSLQTLVFSLLVRDALNQTNM